MFDVCCKSVNLRISRSIYESVAYLQTFPARTDIPFIHSSRYSLHPANFDRISYRRVRRVLKEWENGCKILNHIAIFVRKIAIFSSLKRIVNYFIMCKTVPNEKKIIIGQIECHPRKLKWFLIVNIVLCQSCIEILKFSP